MEMILKRNNTEYLVTIDDEDLQIVEDLQLGIRLTKHNTPYVFDTKTGKMANKYIIPQNPNQIAIHKNGDKLDLRKENLLIVTKKELSSLIVDGEIKTRYNDYGEMVYVC